MEKEGNLPVKTPRLDRTVESIQQIAHSATDIVPIKRRTDDDKIRRPHFFKHLRELIAWQLLSINIDPIVRKIQRLIGVPLQKPRCKSCRISVSVRTAVDKQDSYRCLLILSLCYPKICGTVQPSFGSSALTKPEAMRQTFKHFDLCRLSVSADRLCTPLHRLP